MASSDWEDLINEVPWQSATGATGPVLTTSPSHTSDTMPSHAQQTSVALHAALSRSVIKPLCLCTNQKNTRIGVGHETGYLVFRLVVNEHITSNVDDDDDVELLEPSESCGKEQIASLLRERRLAQGATHHLVLDPLYNMTSEHFTTLYHSMHTKNDDTDKDSAAKDAAISHEPQELDMLLSYTSTTLSQMRIFDEHSPTSNADSNSNSSPSVPHKSAVQEEEGEEDEKRVGFSGGGVGVMALLYEQHCLAVVGGGPRPMSPHNVVLVLHNGAFLQSLSFSAPVVRLFLDARLLFVCTEHELRIYTNPMEREWTACGFQMSFTTTTTNTPTLTTITTNNSVISDTQVVNESLTEGPSRDEASPVRRSTSASTDAARRSLSTATSSFAGTAVTTCSSQARRTLLMPCVMDYAHSCLLLRSAHSPCGFTLLQYSTSAALDSANGLSGQVKVRLCELGSCAAAHRNPLSSLALCLTASGALTSSSTTLACTRPSLVVTQTSLTRTVTHAAVMVAACSAYATRITLWVLLEDNIMNTEEESEAHKSEAAKVTGTTTSSSCHARFVLLREFRVGFRVSPATLLQRATHNVHKQDIHHLQFLQDGRFLFCVRNNRMLVFSVSDEAQGGATRDVCHEHPQAVQNKHSMLLAVNKVLPVQLSLDSYTRQDWASCEAALPMHDAVLYPRWLLLYKQDKAAAAIATARALAQGDTSEPGNREGTEYNNNSSNDRSGIIKGTQGWLGRMSRYVNQVYRAGVEQTGMASASLHTIRKDASTTLNSTTTTRSGHTTCQTLHQCRTQAEEDEEGEHCERQGVHVTEALTQFAPCLLIWEQDKATTTSMKIDCAVHSETSVSSSPSTTVAKPVSGHPPRLYDKEGKILLHCVSCEGAYTTIRLYKDSGDIYCAPALPFTLQ